MAWWWCGFRVKRQVHEEKYSFSSTSSPVLVGTVTKQINRTCYEIILIYFIFQHR